MKNIKVTFTRVSGNSKTGPIPTTMTESSSCPIVCPLKSGGGCYAETGHVALHWRRIGKTTGNSWNDLCSNIEGLPNDQLWRMNVAGDLPHNSQIIDAPMLQQLTRANKGKKGFTYTHHDMTIADNRIAVAKANAYGFTVNLSANNLEHADTLADLGVAPVVTLLEIDADKVSFTPKGRKVIVCPATYRDDVTCSTCKLCAVVSRGTIVGFPVHGVQKKKAEVSRITWHKMQQNRGSV